MRFPSLVACLVAATLANSMPQPSVGNLAEIASYINELNTTWKADPNVVDSVSHTLGFIPDPRVPKTLQTDSISQKPSLPVHFDARHHWPACRSVIDNIRDQGNCDSSWATAAASVISDRICIRSKGQEKVSISTLDVACGSVTPACKGGDPFFSFVNYVLFSGYVTGGEFGSGLGCIPYSLPNCSHTTASGSLPACSSYGPAGETKLHCEAKCSNAKYGQTYAKDQYNGARAGVHSGGASSFDGEATMMTEIATNGPLAVAFDVYEDFLTYKRGVYQHKTGARSGGHAVRVVGWGEEAGGVKYWTVANSWNREWGEGGFFRIRRGNDECGLESMRVVAPVIG